MLEMLRAFNVSISGLIASVFFGIIGMWLFRVGKQKSSYPLVFIAIALMFYPYFTSGPWLDWGVGAGLCGLAYYFWWS